MKTSHVVAAEDKTNERSSCAKVHEHLYGHWYRCTCNFADCVPLDATNELILIVCTSEFL